jgi:hypothetical protein
LKRFALAANLKVEGCGVHLFSDGVLDGILYEGLYGKGGYERFWRGGRYLPSDNQSLTIPLFFYF